MCKYCYDNEPLPNPDDIEVYIECSDGYFTFMVCEGLETETPINFCPMCGRNLNEKA